MKYLMINNQATKLRLYKWFYCNNIEQKFSLQVIIKSVLYRAFNVAYWHPFMLKFSILDQNLDHGDFVYICMKLKEWRVLNGHAVMFDTKIM